MSSRLIEQDICTKLHSTPIHSLKEGGTDNDALISDLPTDTLRWIKKHRRLDCDAKMVLSHNRERQLRDIFNGIDVGKHGSIDLEELDEAVSFVKERLEKKLGTFKGFNQIIKVFKSMDENGDGKVDFREFTNAMSGSAKSALDKASETEIANLHRCFLEFGVLKARRHAIAKINAYTGLSFLGEHNIHMEKGDEEEAQMRRRKSVKSVDSMVVLVDDLRKYNLFRTLFEEQRDTTSTAHTKELEEKVIEEDGKRLAAREHLVKDFIDNHRALMLDTDVDKEAEFDRLQKRLHEDRVQAAKDFAKDSDALALQARHEEGVRYFAEQRRSQRPTTAPNRYLRTADGQPIRGTLSPYTTTMLPADVDARGELGIRLQAKREAYDVLRSIRYMHPMDRLALQHTSGLNQNHTQNQAQNQGRHGPQLSTLQIPKYDASVNVDVTPTSFSCTREESSSGRSSSNIPSSRTSRSFSHRPRSALQKCQSLDALLTGSGPGGASRRRRQDGTPPVTVRLTSHAAILSSSPSSPIVTSRLPAYISTINRPSTANAATARRHVLTAKTPSVASQSAHGRLSLRSPKVMAQSLYG